MTIKRTIFTHRLRVSLAQFLFCWWRQSWCLMTPQWSDNYDASTWKVISRSLYKDFIQGDIHGRSWKKIWRFMNGVRTPTIISYEEQQNYAYLINEDGNCSRTEGNYTLKTLNGPVSKAVWITCNHLNPYITLTWNKPTISIAWCPIPFQVGRHHDLQLIGNSMYRIFMCKV